MSTSTKRPRGRQPGFVPEPTHYKRHYGPTTLLVCLCCRKGFQSTNVKTNRICDTCKRLDAFGGGTR